MTIINNYIRQTIVRGKRDSKSIIHYDFWRSYNSFVDLGYKNHYHAAWE